MCPFQEELHPVLAAEAAERRRPRTIDEDVPLDRGRLWLAGFALVMFILCFTPAPIEPLDIVSKP